MSCRFIKPLSMTPPTGWTYVEPKTEFQIPWGDGTLSKAILALVKHRRGNSLPRADAVEARADIIEYTCQQLTIMGRAKGWCECGLIVLASNTPVAKSSGGCAACGSRKKNRGRPPR